MKGLILAIMLNMGLSLLPRQVHSQPAAGPLQVYFIDVEGGQATLFVTPEHGSLLVDTGWPDHQARDAERIVRTATAAGLSRLDYVLITHYHMDHAGGAPQLLARIPVGSFVDHGENRESSDADTEAAWQAYQTVQGGAIQRLIPKVGDVLPLKGANVTVISSDGALIAQPLQPSAKNSPQCAGVARYPADTTENGRSLGVLLTFGALRILDLGDLTMDKEQELVCPLNRIGKVDIYIVSHHGWNQSSSPLLVNAIAPRVAIMDNGATKGGSPTVIDTLLHSPGLETLWQLHYSEEGGHAHNTDSRHIANIVGPDSGAYLALTAHSDGSFEVLNSRTHESQQYRAR